MVSRNNRTTLAAICIFLAAITWLVFGQTLWHGFVDYDDNDYVYANEVVVKGVTASGLVSAFSRTDSSNWHPLTTISHMIDCQLFDLRAGGHHFTNVLLHTIATVLLFLVLRQMTGGSNSPQDESVRMADRTGGIWRSALVAGVFAIHPLHVESVAWVSERKDVLSGVFFMLTLMAYLRYVRQPSAVRYGWVSLWFVCGLLSKPMLVTLPFVLLLLDVWPLGRFASCAPGSGGDTRGKLIAEKLPLLVLSGLACGTVIFAQKDVIHSVEIVPFALRVYNALISCMSYIGQTFWPARLAAFYPYRVGQLSIWPLALAAALLLAVTAGAWLFRRQKPYLFVGWFWFLGMLVPVIGVLQVGSQARADRYMYLPQIGLSLAVIWGMADWSIASVHRQRLLGALAAATLLLLGCRAWIQTGYWRNTEELWTHTIAVTKDNGVAHRLLGSCLLDSGKLDGAIFHFDQALKIFAKSGLYGFGAAFAHDGLGNALLAKGLIDQAIPHYEAALRLKPDYPIAEYNWGLALSRADRTDEAIAHWKSALALDPTIANACVSLANALFRKQALAEAMSYYERSLRLAPNSPFVLNSFAWALATAPSEYRDSRRAIQLARQANEITHGENPTSLRTLAAAYAADGQFDEAIATAEKALKLVTLKPDPAMANELSSDISLYQIGLPAR